MPPGPLHAGEPGGVPGPHESAGNGLHGYHAVYVEDPGGEEDPHVSAVKAGTGSASPRGLAAARASKEWDIPGG